MLSKCLHSTECNIGLTVGKKRAVQGNENVCAQSHALNTVDSHGPCQYQGILLPHYNAVHALHLYSVFDGLNAHQLAVFVTSHCYQVGLDVFYVSYGTIDDSLHHVKVPSHHNPRTNFQDQGSRIESRALSCALFNCAPVRSTSVDFKVTQSPGKESSMPRLILSLCSFLEHKTVQLSVSTPLS